MSSFVSKSTMTLSPIKHASMQRFKLAKIFVISAVSGLFKSNKLDSCFSGSKLNDFLIWSYNKTNKKYYSLNYDYKKRGNRQSRTPTYVENGSFYIFKSNLLLEEDNRIGRKLDIYKMKLYESFELDEKEDWKLIETIHKNYILENNK